MLLAFSVLLNIIGIVPYVPFVAQAGAAKTARPALSAPARGPLVVSRVNPRYFQDPAGKIVYLTGSHTWDNLVDFGPPAPEFDFSRYLDFLQEHNHNFIRLWRRESTRPFPKNPSFPPLPWQRTGPGEGNDGQPKFDLTRFNEEYFKRLRARVMQAGSRGIYVSIMLFNRFIDWRTHPLNPANNINGINGDANGDGDGREIHTSTSPEVNAVQRAYVKKVVGTVNDLDNVLFEIGNELRSETLAWQYSMIRLINDYEKELPKQHPVGMTSAGAGAQPIANAQLFDSPADWVSPRTEPGQDYSYDPPAGDGQKVIITDTDHLIGQLGKPTPDWVWKSFLRGLNPILMDVIQNTAPGYQDDWNIPDRPFLQETRRAMGQTLHYANRVDLAKMIPAGDLTSTGYCLADPGFEYLVYLPAGSHSVESFATSLSERLGSRLASMELFTRTASVQLPAGGERFEIQWFSPATGKITPGEPTVGQGQQQFTAPFRGDAVLHIRRRSS